MPEVLTSRPSAEHRGASRRTRSRTIKRAVDLVGAAAGLVALAPLLIVVSVAILITMGRPVFFVQQRPGMNAVPFGLVKFRTMRNAPTGVGTELDEVRVTRLGRFLRATSLDELPELVNVLRGDMSLVGPRPLLAEYLDLYSAEQARRHDVRPGITGLAQVSGRKGLSWDETFDLDVHYVDHGTLAIDVQVLVRTVGSLLRTRATATEDFDRPDFAGAARNGIVEVGERSRVEESHEPAALARAETSPLRVLSTEELFAWKVRRGFHVVEHGGHLWERHHGGFYQPLHLLDELPWDDVRRPTATAWGFRAALRSEDRTRATASIPLRLMEDVSNFDPATWSSNRRNQLRRSRKRSDITVASDVSALHRHGWPIVVSAAERIGFDAPRRHAYEAELDAYADLSSVLVLVASTEDGLVGYLTAYATGNTAYVDRVFVHSDSLNTYASIGLIHDLLRICQRTDGVERVVHGVERRENPSLGRFKDGIGFPVVEVPARVVVPSVLRTALARHRPDTLYRLTGRE